MTCSISFLYCYWIYGTLNKIKSKWQWNSSMYMNLYYVISIWCMEIYFSFLFSDLNFVEYVVSTVEYDYAALVEWYWQGKTEVLGEKPLALYVPQIPQVLLWNWNQVSLVRSCLNYGTPPDPSWKTIVYTRCYSKWSVLVTTDIQYLHIQNQSLV